MELRQLSYFVAVAEEAHFRRAARRIAITQPALSQQIAKLEHELGVKLLDRTRRSVALTEAGRAFLVASRHVLAEVDHAVAEARRAGGAEQQRLRVGYFEYINPPFLGAALRRLAQRAPNVQVEARNSYYEETVTAVLDGTLDVGLAMAPVNEPDLVCRRVIEGRWMVVLEASHPLAQLDEVPLARLGAQPLIYFARELNPPLYDRFVAECKQAGFTPRFAYQTTQARTGPTLVAEGLGLFIVGSYVLDVLPTGVVARPLAGFDNRIRLCLVWRADNKSHALRSFLAAARIVDDWSPC